VPLDITASAAAAIQEKLKNSARGFTFILLFTTRRRRRRRCAPFFFLYSFVSFVYFFSYRCGIEEEASSSEENISG
jgi:hypothetical protein